MLTLAGLRDALDAAAIAFADNSDRVCLGWTSEEDHAFEIDLTVTAGDLRAHIAVPGLELDNSERARVREWLDDHGVPARLGSDDDGLTVILLEATAERPDPADAAAWVAGLAGEVGEVLDALATDTDGPDAALGLLLPTVALARTGRPHEAVTELQRLVAVAATSGHRPRARGLLLATLGELLCKLGRTADAVPVIEEAIDVLSEAGHDQLAALAEIGLVAADLAAGRVAAGLTRCDRLAAVLDDAGIPADLDLLAVHRAQLLRASDRYDGAIDLLAGLERRLASTGPSRHLANVRFELGVCLGAIGNTDAALAMIAAAQAEFARTCDVLDVGHCLVARAGALVKAERLDELPDALAAARAVIEPLRAANQLALLDTYEDLLLRMGGDAAAAGNPRPDTAGRPAVSASPGSIHAALAEANVGTAAFTRRDYPAAIVAYERAATRLEDLGLPVELARVRHNLAVTRLSSAAMAGRIEASDVASVLADALAAVHLIEEARQDFAAVAGRGRWAADTSSIYALAIQLHHAVGRPRDVVDLLERTRAQGLPDLRATEVTPRTGLVLGDAPMSEPDRTAAAPQGEADAALDAARASLRDLSVAVPPPCDLANATHAVGGPYAWRWTLWQASGIVFWGLVEAGGRHHSGHVLVDEPRVDLATLPDQFVDTLEVDERAGPELAQLAAAQGRGIVSLSRRVAAIEHGPLGEDRADAEPALAWDLGRKLLPSPLAAELRRRLDRGGEPLPLVIAPSPSLANVPFGLLAVDEPCDRQPTGRRLVEAAVITIAPPSSVAMARHRARRRTRPPLPVRLAVVNPTGDLSDSLPVTPDDPDGAAEVETVLQAPVTRHEVLAALRTLPSGLPGVLYWDGHAEPGPSGRPLDARWPLSYGADGCADQWLSVQDILREEVHAPSRAVLFGCATLGIDGGLNEWWGFPVALLAVGASAVAANTWDLLDCPASTAFAAEVLRQAIEADDLATGMRAAQLRWLAEWRERRAAERAIKDDGGDRHPHFWAGWTVVGLRHG